MHIKTKAATFWQLTFSVILLSTFIACQDPGNLGGDFVEKSEIDIDTLLVQNISISNQDPYLGRLNRSAVGMFNDGLFGEIESSTFFKPGITKSDEDQVLPSTATLRLNLKFFDDVFGDTTTIGDYLLYRVQSPWRGSSFRKSMDITYSTDEIIGSFSDTDIDTNGIAQILLSGSWKNDYISFYNSPDSIKNEEYKQNDFGLVIVPDQGNNKILYADYTLSSLTHIDRFDTTSTSILDWAVDLESNNPVVQAGTINLQSTFENVLRLNLNSIGDELSNVNFVRAELVFNVDTLAINTSLTNSQVRSSSLGLAVVIDPDSDVSYELGFGLIDLSAAIREDGTIRLNITNFLNDYIQLGNPLEDVYIYLNSNQGALAYTRIFDTNSSSNVVPKVIVYGLKSGE
jgi:hypothetical protein